MAILYRVYERKNKLPNATRPNIAVAVPKQLGVIKLRELAEDISDRCTVHRADVMAVLEVLSLSTISFLNKGFGVELGGLGHFGIRLKSKSAESKKAFKPELIRGAMVRYTPSVEMKNKMSTGSFLNYDSFFGKEKEGNAPEGSSENTLTPPSQGSEDGGVI